MKNSAFLYLGVIVYVFCECAVFHDLGQFHWAPQSPEQLLSDGITLLVLGVAFIVDELEKLNKKK